MNRSILFGILLLSTSSFGQVKTDTLSSNKARRLLIGVNFSSDYCYRTLTKNDNSISDSLWIYAKHIEDSIEIAKFGYTIGISFSYQFNKRLSAEIGIQYSNKGYKTIPIETLSVDESGNIFFSERATNYLSFLYLDIPVKANYVFFQKRTQLITSLGVTLNILQTTRFKSISETTSEEFVTSADDYPYKKINLSPFVSAGLVYNVSDKINLRFEPSFRYSIFGIDDKSYENRHFWSMGLNLGFYYKL